MKEELTTDPACDSDHSTHHEEQPISSSSSCSNGDHQMETTIVEKDSSDLVVNTSPPITLDSTTMIAKHNGQEYSFEFPLDHTVYDLKCKLWQLTRVHMDRQKLITKSLKMRKWFSSGSVNQRASSSSCISTASTASSSSAVNIVATTATVTSSSDSVVVVNQVVERSGATLRSSGIFDVQKASSSSSVTNKRKRGELQEDTDADINNGNPRKSVLRFMLVGTPDNQIFKDPSQMEELPLVIDDLEHDYFPDDRVQSLASDPIHLTKLSRIIDHVHVHLINAPRQGKKLCVLDIDYTIFDCKHVRESEHPIEMHMRPFVHEFLTKIYQHYDIVFWSQTKWLWVESKLTDMGILTHTDYKINFVLDKESMFKVKWTHNETKQAKEHYVKPLQFIYAKFPQFYHSRNTIHVDDLSRNFAMNPHNGVKIKQFKDCAKSRQTDTELKRLAKYLNHVVAHVDDVRQCNNRKWKKELKQFYISKSKSIREGKGRVQRKS